jgi:uncharacterized MAPEG superfamily protein
MSTDLRLLTYSVVLTWVMLLTASLVRARAWTMPGTVVALGNRDDVPEPSPLAGRADRAARNMVENLVMFGSLVCVANLLRLPSERLELGARLFFYARVLYFPVYLAGIKYVRTAVWAVSVVGMIEILQAIVVGG